MKLAERLALIKAGYKKNEIAEIEAAENEPETKDPETKDPETKDPETKDPEPDYKSMYEKMKKDLEAAQAANRNQAAKASEPYDLDKELDELVKNLF